MWKISQESVGYTKLKFYVVILSVTNVVLEVPYAW
jgi:hypothetical protein